MATSSTWWPSHSPSASRNVGTPLSAEIPAPVSTTILTLQFYQSGDRPRHLPTHRRRDDLPDR